MSKKIIKPTVQTNGTGLYKVYTVCANGHKHYYECGVIIDPIPVVAECCGANVIKSGSDICGEG